MFIIQEVFTALILDSSIEYFVFSHLMPGKKKFIDYFFIVGLLDQYLKKVETAYSREIPITLYVHFVSMCRCCYQAFAILYFLL